MGRLFILFFALPWWVFFPLAGGAAWLGERAHSAALEVQAERAAAFEAGPPEAVDIGQFDFARDRHLADEVTLRGWIDADLSYELEKTVKGVTLAHRYMYLLFGEGDPDGNEVVRGAIVLTESERDTFAERLETTWVDFSRDGYIFEINGLAKTHVAHDDLAFGAIDEQGLSRDANFVFLEPFLNGREAALAPDAAAQDNRQVYWIVAIGLALIGTVKRVFAVLFHKHSDDPVAPDAEVAEPAPAPAVFHSSVAANSPLGRLSRVQSAQAMPDDVVWEEDEAVPEEEIEDDWERADAYAEETVAPDQPAPNRIGDLILEDVEYTALDPIDEVQEAESDVAPVPAKGSGEIAFFLRLLPAMVLVGLLAYDLSMALALLRVVIPVALVVLVIWRVVRMVANRGASEAT